MPRKKTAGNTPDMNNDAPLALIEEQNITQTLEINYMPYAMSVIVSRALPEIDGFKPSHRKLLYTMYKMGLLTGQKTKCANIVGQTMRLNPHGDAAIYDTLVRLSRGNGALLHPFIDSKGNFGKVFSRDMAYAASRYTEAKLEKICREIFGDIDSDTVDFQDNYDNSMKEPVLLPTAFPNILTSVNQGIAVGMACQICGFNLSEVCATTIALLKDPKHDIMTTLVAPDLPTGGEILYDRDALQKIYETGKGSFRLRARWRYIDRLNLIEIFELPYNTTIEAVLDETAKLIKAGKLKEISDMRDETDLNGLKLTIDLKRGVNPQALMQKLMRHTSLTKSYPCNFNILVAGTPRLLGVRDILTEWIAWRIDCVRRRIYHDLGIKKDKLHLLKGLEAILLDIDRAIRIIRETEKESQVVPNLVAGFGIDELQAEYIAEIRLRNINREFILKRTQDIEALIAEIAVLEGILNSPKKVRDVIIGELKQISKTYGIPRRTIIIYDAPEEAEQKEDIPDYPVNLFLSREGYFKKITPQSLRMGNVQKYKPEDGPRWSFECSNADELLLFTNKAQAYPLRVSDFADMKASLLGEYLPARLGMDEGEEILSAVLPGDYSGFLVIAFRNGKAVRLPLNVYATKTNRRKLTGAFCPDSPVVDIFSMKEERELVFTSDDRRALIIKTDQIPQKATRTSQGVAIMKFKARHYLEQVQYPEDSSIVNKSRYKVRSTPAAGAILKPEDSFERQLNLDEI